VLIPLLFMGDIVGRLFREFAVTLSVDHPGLGVVSLTLTPMMCAKLLKHKPEASRARFYRSRSASSSIIAFYGARCVGARHQTLTLLVAVATLVLTVCSTSSSCPRASSRCRTPASSRASPRRRRRLLPAMAQRQQQLAKVILKDPASRACPRSSASTAPTPRSTAAASRST
jgi:multidrug efflux pump